MRDFYMAYELNYVRRLHTLRGFVSEDLFFKPLRQLFFYAGIALLLPLIMLRRVLLDRRIRFLVVCVAVLAAGMLSGTFLIPHYLAPFTAAFYAIGLQAMRHLRLWNPDSRPVARAWCACWLLCASSWVEIRLFAEPLHLRLAAWPGSQWSSNWYGPGRLGLAREQVKRKLEQLPGKQLAIVRDSPRHSSLDEWVYNAPDIDGSKVVWAREMDAADNLRNHSLLQRPERYGWCSRIWILPIFQGILRLNKELAVHFRKRISLGFAFFPQVETCSKRAYSQSIQFVIEPAPALSCIRWSSRSSCSGSNCRCGP